MVSNNQTKSKNTQNSKLKNEFNSNVKRNIIFMITNPIQIKNSGISPFFEYEGIDGYKSVKFILKKDEEIRAEGGTLSYIRNDIIIETKTNGFLTGLYRKLSGSSFFFNVFKNISDRLGTVTFSSIVPGDIGCFYIPPGKKFNYVSDTYICSTPNLQITTNIRFGGLLLGYGLTFVQVESIDNQPGLVWISSFGKVIELILKQDESVKIDNGILLGFDADIKINTESVGGIKSFFFSGEGLLSKITNINNTDIKIYLQSKSKTQYIKYLRKVTYQNKNSMGKMLNY